MPSLVGRQECAGCRPTGPRRVQRPKTQGWDPASTALVMPASACRSSGRVACFDARYSSLISFFVSGGGAGSAVGAPRPRNSQSLTPYATAQTAPRQPFSTRNTAKSLLRWRSGLPGVSASRRGLPILTGHALTQVNALGGASKGTLAAFRPRPRPRAARAGWPRGNRLQFPGVILATEGVD